mmetsp:Transcript_20948/g.30814  ORF Transcript_20948/g.30814 Transcript_20948/m.30814 type:complete len:1041 (-) Transcript_20948:80-3202(-)
MGRLRQTSSRGLNLQLISLLLATFTCTFLRNADGFSVSNKTKTNKRSLPETALINRRKSPALWRDDETLTLTPTSTATATPIEEANKSASDIAKETRTISLQLPKRPPEIMAPVGGFPQLKAAIANGADSVYLGLSAFSARARASNFSPTELAEAVQIAHKYGVRVFVALNTLVFQHELKEVAEWIRICKVAHVDALIIQDFGVAKLAREIAPDMEIHASTQQTVTDTDGVMYAKERGGATRVVLGRELSVKEIESVTRDMQNLGEEEVEVETFVHGALCVSYSGQCFSSEAWGGRSANRGQCAQACRLPYGLIQNGELTDLEDMSYLLSPQDLCGLDQVEGLVRAGVSCLKIEGRLKDSSYVAATTRAYRNAVDEVWAKIEEERGQQESAVGSDKKVDSFMRNRILDDPSQGVTKSELAQLFSRGQDEEHDGLSPGFFEGAMHQKVVRGRSPRHRGVYAGEVMEGSSPRNGLVIDSKIDLKRGDGIVVDRGLPEDIELGGPIFDVQDMRDGTSVIRFGKGVEKEWRKTDDESNRGLGSRTPLAPTGAIVWRSSDATVDKKMKKLIEASPPKGLVSVKVSGKKGSQLKVEVKDLITGEVGVGESEGVLEEAQSTGIEEKSVRKAVGTFGNTKWTLPGDGSGLDLSDLDDNLWCPISWVKKARQAAVSSLTQSGSNKEEETQHYDESLLDIDEDGPGAATVENMILESSSLRPDEKDLRKTKTSVSVLARNQAQVNALCEMVASGFEVDEIIIDFLEVDGMREAVARVREMEDEYTTRVVLATSRIIKPGESGIWKSLLQLEPDGLLIRSAGLIHTLTSLGGEGAEITVGNKKVLIPEMIGDFSLNAINTITSDELLDYGQLRRITAAYDLSANAITELAKAMGPKANKMEVIAHTHLPIFHTEHCVFARFLTNGNSYVDCGHACTRNNIHLRDQSGKDNLVLADMGCRNTVFSAEAQSGIHSLHDWSNAGVGTIRIELVDEGKNDVKKIVKGYLDVLQGNEKASSVYEILGEVVDSNGRQGGVGFGSLRNGVERRAGEIS